MHVSTQFEQVDDSVRIPYIGGARGQILEIRQRPDGTIFSRILMDESKNDFKRDTDFDPFQNARAEQPQENSFESNLASIQQAAADLVTIQEIFKEQGRLTIEQRKIYSQSLEKLGVSAQKLANIHGTDDEIKLLLEEPSGDKTTKSPPKKKTPENPRFPPYNFKKTEQQKKEEECEESQGVVEEGASTTKSPTTTKSPSTTKLTTTLTSSSTTTKTTKKPVVIVTSSLSATSGNSQVQNDDSDGDEESSVAEAKPVGLAIAGVGGVASSKPSGTAVVGPGGLAVARPVATAIAGLKPGEYSQLGLPIPGKVRNIATSSRGASSLPYRGKYGIVSFGMDDEGDSGRILVGPEYLSEARLADKNADDDDEDNFNEKVEYDGNSRNNVRDNEHLKRPVVLEEEKEEDSRDYENPYGTAEYGKFPLFPVTQDRYNFQQNPYFLPPNSYVPIPIANQYLQRRAFNPAAMRYQQAISQYPSYYGQDQYNTHASPYSPYRVFYAPQ